MNISNASTNVYQFSGHWPDGSVQVIQLQPGQTLHIPSFEGLATTGGGIYSTQQVSDSYAHMYQVVVDNGGAFVHEDYNSSAFIMSGFFWATPMVLVWLLIFFVVRGLRQNVPGRSDD